MTRGFRPEDAPLWEGAYWLLNATIDWAADEMTPEDRQLFLRIALSRIVDELELVAAGRGKLRRAA